MRFKDHLQTKTSVNRCDEGKKTSMLRSSGEFGVAHLLDFSLKICIFFVNHLGKPDLFRCGLETDETVKYLSKSKFSGLSTVSQDDMNC